MGDTVEAAPQLCTSVVLLLAREQSHGKCFLNQTLDGLENQTNAGLIFHENLENLIPSPIACSSLCYFLIPLLAAHQVNGRFHAASHSASNFQAVDVTGMLPVSAFQLHVDPPIFAAAEIRIFIFACIYQQLHDQICRCLQLTSPIRTHIFPYVQEKARAPFTIWSSASHPHPKNGWSRAEKAMGVAMKYSTKPSSSPLPPVLQYQV